MQVPHDKHTYYFEKYLRNEMLGDEKRAFENKLREDADFKSHFDTYAFNHDEIVKQELEEYYNEEIIPDKPQKSYSWILVSLSILGIVLLADFYANRKYYEEQQATQTYKQVLVDRIKGAIVYPFNFFIPKDKNKEKTNSQITTVSGSNETFIPDDSLADTAENDMIDSSKIEAVIEEQFSEIAGNNGNIMVAKDYLLIDSLMYVFELEKFKDKFRLILQSTDSTLADSTITRLTLQSLNKNELNTKPLFVEFWYSIVGFKGYYFNGKKLVIYGIDKPFKAFILKQNNLYVLHSDWGETALQADNQLHRFEN
ncbi:MAG: hypothetical protein V4538_10335 [Bacteroidota bacterium]